MYVCMFRSRGGISTNEKEEKTGRTNGTNLETVDISIEEGVTENRNQESIYNKTLEKGKEKERSKKDLEETVFTTGGLWGAVIN